MFECSRCVRAALRAIILSIVAFFPLTAWTDATVVTTRTFSVLAIQPETSVAAAVLSLNDSRLSSQVNAVIRAIPVSVGQTVEPGAVLVEMESADFRLAVEQARATLAEVTANLELARYQLQRAEQLAKQNAIAQELLMQRRGETKALEARQVAQQAAVDMAERNLAKCTVRAPFRAVVTERSAQVGELAAPGAPLMRIVDAERLEIAASIHAQDVESLRTGSNLRFIADGTAYPAQLRVITPVFDPRQRSREARLQFTGTPALAGTAGRLTWRSGTPHLPAELLVRRGGRLGVFIVKDGSARFMALNNAQEGRPAALELDPSTPVIVDGRFAVQDGQRVTQP